VLAYGFILEEEYIFLYTTKKILTLFVISHHYISPAIDGKDSGGAIRGGEWGGHPPDSRFVTYGAPVHQVVNVYNYAIHF